MLFTVFLPYFFLLVALIATIELLHGRETQIASAKARWPVNLALILIASGLGAMVPFSGFTAGYWAREENIGLFNILGVSGIIAFIVSFVLMSFWYFLVHLASHKIPLLWRFHKVHHSDYDLDVTSAFRQHPLIGVFMSAANAILVIVLGLYPEAIIAHAVIVLLIDVWHHTALQTHAPIDAALRHYIITPRIHHIHHSDHVSETETNFGHDLAIWDHIFGTYLEAPKRSQQEFRYGLTQYPKERANDLDVQLLAPFGKDSNS